MGNVYPLHGTVERTGEFQHGELKRMMPGVKKVSVAAYRVPVQRGHLAGLPGPLAPHGYKLAPP